MMGLAEIRAASDSATRRARQRQVLPYQPTAEQLKEHAAGHLAPAYIPFMGDYIPRGWRWAQDNEGSDLPSLFVDSYGIGSDSEPALSWRKFALEIAADAGRYAYGTIEAGQFQRYVARFERVPYVPRAGHRVRYTATLLPSRTGQTGRVIGTRKHGERALVLFDDDAARFTGELSRAAHAVEVFPVNLQRIYKRR